MATTPAHTPAPWTIRNTVIVDSTPDSAGKFVGQCPLLDTCPDVAANRRHVVKCVNSHDELLDLVALCLPYMEDAQKDPAYKKGAVAPLVKRIHKAITAAEGKK